MSSESLASLDRSPLRERALEAVRSAILFGQYRPGDHHGKVEQATSLGVNQARCARRYGSFSTRTCHRGQPRHARNQQPDPDRGPPSERSTP